jgi:Protein of unknown function (DUF2909)
MTYLVILGFIAILGSLATAMFFMLKGGEKERQDHLSKPNKMARALALRVGLSILLFICILVAWKLGYIHPTGIVVGS